MKTKIMSIGVLLILSLLSLPVLSLGIQPASAANYASGVFCPNNWSPAPPPDGAGDTGPELSLSQQACQYIHNYLNAHYDGVCYYYWGDTVPPNPPSNPRVYPSTYLNTLTSLEQANNKVTIFSKGHCVPWGSGNHYKLLCTDNPDAATDNDIFLATNQAKCKFDFIWHCGTARSYPVAPPYRDADGYIGMPLAFTHNVALTKYGSSGVAVFAGWDWRSPQFENPIPENTDWQWAQFATGVFYYMHNNPTWSLGYTLNYLSSQIYGTSFQYSPLYNSLVVWGNMNMVLSY
ncbi:MAG: hypothetical protein ACQCN3_09195 [Candidatus Bathyarchaeia archaeon]|jgi:hypothetical protein